MRQPKKLKTIPLPTEAEYAGFHEDGQLPDKNAVLQFLEGYARRMESLAQNEYIPRAQCRVAGENARAAKKVMAAVKERTAKDLLADPIDLTSAIEAAKEAEADALGLKVARAEPEFATDDEEETFEDDDNPVF